jgi:hypothetical protein
MGVDCQVRFPASTSSRPALPSFPESAVAAIRRRSLGERKFRLKRDVIRLASEVVVGRRALCLIRARRQGQARSTGRALTRASLDSSARLRLSVSMIFVERAGLAAGFARQRSWKQNRRIGAAQSPRSGRSEAQQPRSGLTATIRCGHPRHEVCVAAEQPGCRGRGVASREHFTRKPYHRRRLRRSRPLTPHFDRKKVSSQRSAANGGGWGARRT